MIQQCAMQENRLETVIKNNPDAKYISAILLLLHKKNPANNVCPSNPQILMNRSSFCNQKDFKWKCSDLGKVKRMIFGILPFNSKIQLSILIMKLF